MRQVKFGLFVLLAIALAGCGSSAGTIANAAPDAATLTPLPTRTPASQPGPGPGPDASSTRTDSQGAVVVEITPVDLKTSGDTLVFNVSLNTHSVDLSMDLAATATLATDTGRSVNALSWEAPKGGHHVTGTLTFPASAGGARLLAGALKLTLSIKDLNAPERAFTWDLNP